MDAESLLRERALQVVLKISYWTGTRIDKQLTKETVHKHQVTDPKAVRVSKTLLPTATALKLIKKVAGKARNYNYDTTRAWNDDGARILPTKLYNKHLQQINEYKLEFEQHLADFLKQYENYIQEAQQTLGTAFSASDYPSPQILSTKFKFQLDHYPIPSAKDFRVTLSPQQLQRIDNQIKTSAQAAIFESRKKLYERLHTLIAHMASKLSDPKGKFKNTLTANIASLCDIMDALNIEQDSQLKLLTAQAQPLGQLNPQQLRDDADLRKTTAEQAQKLAKHIETTMRQFTQ